MELLSWGANGNGQLGHGHDEENVVSRPTPVPGAEHLRLDKVKQVVGGGAHTILIVDDGSLYVCGRNNRGQLGLPKEKSLFTLQPVVFSNLKVKTVACGWEHNLAISEDGSLFTWGANAFGQLGVPSTSVQCTETPIRINVTHGDVCVTDISAGIRHSSAVTVTGKVFCWGSGKKGQLGSISTNGQPPKQVDLPSPVPLPDEAAAVRVVCGSYHTALLTGCGHLCVWGNNDHGQLTQNPDSIRSVPTPHLVPTKVFHGSKLKAIYSGWTHMMAVTEEGKLFSWGRNDYGQLGRATGSKSHDWMPGSVTDLKDAKKIFVGSEHNVAVMSDANSGEERLLTWGWNEHGICGNGTEEYVLLPTEISRLEHNCVLLGGGCGHNFLMTAPASS